jgi:SAM-dependent methyltransferase
MHLSSLEKMRDFTSRYLSDMTDKPLEILDLGSADIGGTYAQFFDHPQWRYRGIDLAEGPNIHVVLSNPYNWRELPTHCADVFISGQTFEHIEFFWLTMLEIARVLKPGGLCCIVAPSRGPIHRYPVDCWRFYPDGFAALARYADLEILEILHDEEDIPTYPDKSEEWGDLVLIARKKKEETTPQEYDATVYEDGQDSWAKITRMVPSNSVVLELGPAKGYITRHLKEKLNCVVDCVELSPEMAEQARPAARHMVVGDLNTLDLSAHFVPESYDVVMAADVLEHLHYDNTVLEQSHELLKEGGLMLVSVPNIAHAAVIGALCRGDFPYAPDGLLDRTHIRFFTRRSICQALTQAGFAIERIDLVSKAPHETALGDTPADLPLPLESYLRDLPDAQAYQFVIAARKGPAQTDLLIETPSPRAVQEHFTRSLFRQMEEQRVHFTTQIEEQRIHFTTQMESEQRERAVLADTCRRTEQELDQTRLQLQAKQQEISDLEVTCLEAHMRVQERDALILDLKTRPWRVLWRKLKNLRSS